MSMKLNLELDKNFEYILLKLKKQYGEDLAKLNGLSEKQLDLTEFIDNFVDHGVVADTSVDPSSNVARKDMPTLLGEISKSHKALLSFNKIYMEIMQKYGRKAADKWFTANYDGHLYLHDSTSSSFLSYCFAYDLKDLAERGLFFLDNGTFNAQPPKHAETFIDFVKEFVSFNANRTSGAVGLPNLLPYLWYFCNKDLESGYTSLDTERFQRQQIQRFVYAVNQPYVRDGIQSAFTNTSVFDHPYFVALFGGSEFPDGTFMIDFEDEIIEFEKVFLDEVAKIRQNNMFTFPVNTISLLWDKEKDDFADLDFANWAIEHNRHWSDSNIFADTSVNSLSNCCRLKSNIEDLGYFNSIGGTALKVGSVKVSTINLARLALENKTEDDYFKHLKELVLLNCECLDRVRYIISRNVDRGLLQNFSSGLIDFEHLYNTIGFIGIYEALKTFGYTKQDEFGNTYYTEDGFKFGKKIFEIIREVADKFLADNSLDYHINVEQSPAENAADKIMRKDKLFFPNDVVDDLPLYGNQFMPLGIKSTLVERVRVQAAFDSYCNGGSILHANIDAPFDTFEKAMEMTKYIIRSGVTYFAFNTKINTCESNHSFYGNVCPICGKGVSNTWTRIVGFYRPVSSWSEARRDEFDLRLWEKVNNA